MTTTEKVQEILASAITEEESNIQPSIIMNRNCDPEKVIELTTCHVNDIWAKKIKELLEDGFVIMRIQTEFQLNGHETIAYFVKLRD